MNTNKNNIIKYSIFIALSSLFLFTDLLTKFIAQTTLEGKKPMVLIDGVLELLFIRNEGAAWGMLSNHRWVFMTITAIAIIVLPIILYKYRKLHFLFGFSLSLIIGGAIGNMIDRVFLGYVIDFIYLPFLDFIFGPGGFPRFNIADCCATVGVALMFIYLVFIDKTFFEGEKAKTKVEETKNDEA